MDNDILVTGICEEFLVSGGQVVLKLSNLEIEPFSEIAFVLVHRGIPEKQ
ncbi:MAG: hypothetical protein WCF90_04080 [Methanomicrobiales archaeon]